jgi:ParB family chromosome partitioning protein
MKLPDGKSRIDLVKAGLTGNFSKRGRMVVDIRRLLEDPKNERKTFRNMNGLVESIRAVGLVEPITVTPEGESYRILTGHRRFRAAKEAGLHEVEILIREPEADLMRRRKSVVSNVQREDVGIIELAEALQDLLENDPTIRTQRELSRIIGKTESWLSDVLRVLTLPADIRTKLRTSEVAVPYDSAIRIARAANPITQRSLVELALKGASVAEIRQRAKSIAKKSTAPGVKFQTTKRGYTAIVHGPAAPDANEKMVATLKALIEQVKNQLN